MKNVADVYPLAPTQLGMVFHTIQAPHSGVYVQQFVCKLNGPLDQAVFAQTWQQVIDSHPVLRTAFIWEGVDEPLQVVRQKVTLPIQHEDWQSLTEEVQQTKLAQFLQTDRQQGFNLAKAPLMRLHLCQTEPECHQLIWSSHHVILDGWSVPGVLKEVFARYQAISQQQTLNLPPRALYRDYIAWLNQQDMAAAEAFWRNRLAGLTAPTPLVIDHHAAPATMGDSQYQQYSTRLDAPLTDKLQQVARANRITLNSLVQAAWALLLNRYSGEQEVVFGATVSGRPASLPGVETMIGLFINTLPVRLKIEPSQRLTDWFGDIQRAALEQQQYEFAPLARVQGWAGIPGGEALFDSILVFENYPSDGGSFLPDGSYLQMSQIQYHEQSNYPLGVLAVPGEQFQLHLIYDAGRFAAEAIQRLAGHLATILTDMAVHPDKTLAEVSMLTSAELEQQLLTWNETAVSQPDESCITHYIEQNWPKNRLQVAVTNGEQSYTYQALDQRSNQLARHLIAMGVGPDTIVGLCLDRSPDMMVGILGILKAGGAYLPLDPSYPGKRLSDMVTDAHALVIISQAHLAAKLPTNGALLLNLDADWPEISQQMVHPIPQMANADNLAYVIYTSGSTGRPKGVPITHRNLVHSTLSRFSYYPDPVERFLLLSSYSFDSSVVGIFWTLCQGGTLVLAPERAEQDIAGLAALIEQMQITHTLCLPSLYNLLLTYADPTQLASLKTVIVAGEACPQAVTVRHHHLLPQARLYNEYGPTEGTVWATVYESRPTDTASVVPIGQPIENMQAYILDEALRPVPVGIPGELYIAGAGLASGYLHRPELTARRFIHHTFPNGHQTRLYRTGDLARFGADGNIQFLGRADNQLKIRGYRIELSEIEAVLAEQADLQAVVVTADNGDRTSLAADDLAGLAEALNELDPIEADELLTEIEAININAIEA